MENMQPSDAVLESFASVALDALDTLSAPVYIKDSNLRFVWLNRAYFGMLKLAAREEALGKTDSDIYDPETAATLHDAEKALLDGKSPIRDMLADIPCPDGVRRSFVRDLAPVLRQGSPAGLIGFCAEAARPVSEQKAFFEDLFVNAASVAAVTDEKGDIIRINKKAALMFFGEEGNEHSAEGKNILDFIHADDRQKAVKLWKKSIAEKKEVNYQIRMKTYDGRVLYLLISGRPIVREGRVVSLHYQALDMIDQKAQEKNLLHSESIEMLGQLVGGFAHDFNNLLTVINGYSEMMLRTIDSSHPFYGKLSQICQAGGQASMLTQKILEFSRKNRSEPKEIDISEELANQETILKHVIDENVKLTVQKAEGLGKIKIDPAQFAKVLLNLVINAKEAIQGSGEIVVSAGAMIVDESNAHLYHNIQSGKYLLLRVRDTGSGMSDEVKQHIFDPFFTTREGGKGIGLWAVNSIVKDAKGSIHVESTPAGGTTFTILLPFSGEVHADPAPAPSDITGKTILVVEDDDTVRELVSEILKHKGHHILTAINGGDALQLARQYEGGIDLLITDMVMRRIDGIMLSKKMRSILPDIRVMLMSGYGEDVIRHEELEDITFLQKPFLPQDLIARVDVIFSNDAKTG